MSPSLHCYHLSSFLYGTKLIYCYIYRYANRVPMKRLGSIEEVIKSVAYLLSDDSSYTTGTNLVIDGGLSSGLKA